MIMFDSCGSVHCNLLAFIISTLYMQWVMFGLNYVMPLFPWKNK